MLKLKQFIRRLNKTAHFDEVRNYSKCAFYIKQIKLWTREDLEIPKIYL